MYDYGDNKRKAKICNPLILANLSFGAAHKKQNDHRTVPWSYRTVPWSYSGFYNRFSLFDY